MENQYCVIMAGGVGSRFWPMSRSQHPKQFIDILGTGRTLLQQTYDRFRKLCPPENIFVVTNDSYQDLVKQQLPELDNHQILSEPVRRNTAPCIAYASYKISSINDNANIIVAPSDHIIMKEDVFLSAVERGMRFTETRDALVTLGIHPSRPDTGYGYIQIDEQNFQKEYKVYKVKTFTEKPNVEMAKFFLQSGEFLWNSGIFIWNVNSIIKAFQNTLPEISNLFKEGSKHYYTDGEAEFIKKVYTLCTNISIDYGILEKAENVYVLPSEFGWSDLGTWGSLYEHSEKDDNGNSVVGNNVLLYDSTNCIINVPEEKLVVIQGLKDFIIAESDGILLICRKEDEQEIKLFVNDVKISKGDRFV
jgi:mannose-1-phosphate guanylyltransferase